MLFYLWLLSLPIGALAASALLGALGISTGPALPVAALLLRYAWIVISIWTAYGLLWLGLSVPGLRVLLSRATLTRGYRRYRGPGGTRD